METSVFNGGPEAVAYQLLQDVLLIEGKSLVKTGPLALSTLNKASYLRLYAECLKVVWAPDTVLDKAT